MTKLKFKSKRTVWNMCYLEQEITDSFSHDIHKTATPLTTMDETSDKTKPRW